MIAEWKERWRKVSPDHVAKAVALILAVITWYAIQPSISFETTISDVPVRVMVDPGWAVLEQSVGSVDVHFRGSREGIRYLQQEELEVVADVRGWEYGETFALPLDVRSVRSPTGVRPVFMRPSELLLTIDQEEDIQLPVRVHIQGSPPEGYEVENVVANPAMVTVSGPRQRLEAIDAIRTVPIDLEGRLQSFKLRVALVTPSRAWTARMEPERVEVDITLVERAATRVMEDVRVRSLFGTQVIPDTVIAPTHVTVHLVGRSEILDKLVPRDISLYVDLSGLEPGFHEALPVRVHLPPRIRLDQIEPSTVSVQLGKADVAETGEETVP